MNFTPMNREVTTIFFDAAGTLIYLPRGVGYHYADVAGRHGWTVDPEALGRIFKGVWTEMLPATMPRHPREGDERGWWRELVRRVLKIAGPPGPFDGNAYFEELYVEFERPGVWALYPDVKPVLEALRGRYSISILSNFDGRLRPVLADLGILECFREVLISSEIGADKPSRCAFDLAVARAGITPAQAFMVGDDADADVAGALAAGWRAFHVDRPRATLLDMLAMLPT